MKKLLLGLLTLLLPSMAFAAYSGDPTPSDILAKNKDSNGCYQISSAEDLYGFANVVKEGEASACGKLIEDIEVNANVLDEDGNLNTTLENGFKAWTPIGTILKPFSGTFDGNNKKISGLYFNNSSGREVGLIGYVTEGSGKKPVSIKDVGVVDSYIKGGNFVGGLVGSACKATVTITNSYIVGDVNGIGNHVGGLVGYIDGSATITITNSYIVGDIKGNYKVGGMVGEAYSSATISITNSYSAGNVNGTNYVGGMFGEVYTESTVSVTNSFALEGSTGKLVGEGTATITSSGFASKDEFNNGTVAYALHNSEGGSSWGQSVGVDKFPLLGKSLTNKDGNAFKTYSITYHLNGGVSSKNQFEFYLAGVGLELPTPIRYGSVFLGWYTNENFSGNVIKKIDKSETGAKTFYAKWKTDIKLVNDCYEIYTADGLYQFAQIVNGEHAGFTKDAAACGKLMKDIVVNENVLDEDGNLNAGDFKAWTPIGNVNNRFEGSFDGNGKKISGLYFNASKDYVGLFGYVQGGTAKEPVSIKDVGVVDSYISGRDYVGGLLGLVSGTVSITNSYSAGRVTGSGNYVGGLVGGAYGSVSITNSYSAGRVTGSGNNVGGLLGSVSRTATITNSFVLEGAAEKQVGYGEVTMTSSGFASKDDFSNGMVAYALHIGVGGSSWGQSVGTDEFPLLGKGLTDKDGNAFKAYTIAYNLNGGSFSKYHFNFYLVGVGKDPLPTPVLAGYSFLGWFANKNFSGNVVTKIEKSEKENKDFYAKWEKPLELVNDCYEIYTADDLYQFARIVNGKHATIAKNTAACGKLMKDIVVNEHVLDYTDNLGNVISGCATSSNCASSWATIGAYTSDGAKAYSGSFDGNGHTISGLYEKTTYNYVGFFSAIKGAKISNLGIVDSYFYGPKQNNGALVGISVGKDTIEACFSKSFVDGVDNVVGGLVGRSSGDLIIKNSHNEGHVRSTKTIVGGLVGFQEKGTLNISESYNIGFVNGSYNVGGLVGFQEKGTLNISESYNVGSIEGKVSEGGLVGRADAELTIVNAWNAGAISGTGAGEVGGLVGHVYSGNTSVMNSYNVGSLSISSPSETEKYLGGLVARASGSLSVANSYSLTAPVNGDVYDGATKAAETEFHDGTVAYALHDWCETYAADGKTCAAGGANGAVWGQHVGHDAYPVLSNTYDDAGNLVPGVITIDDGYLFDINYVLNDGINAAGAVDKHAYGIETTLLNPTRTGYTFAGWFTSSDFSGSAVTSIAADAIGAKTFYAKWVEKTIELVEGWYEIYNADGLYKFADIVNGTNGETANSGACGKLMEDIYVNGRAERPLLGQLEYDENGNVTNSSDFRLWTPIGTSDNPFSGKFDGNGHTISGLYFNDDSKRYVGLFGYVAGGTAKEPVSIKDVGVVDSYIKGENGVGGLVGYAYNGSTVSITNSYNVGSVTGSGNEVGGLLGYANEGSTVSITNSYSGGDVNGNYRVGGLLGDASSATVRITNSFAKTGSADALVGYGTASTTSSGFVSEDEFNNGTVVLALRDWCEQNDVGDACKDGGLNGAAWGQDIGNDDYPTLSGSITVNGVESVKYSISYNLNGGSFTKNEINSYLSGVGKDSLPIPVRVAHTFLGWYTDENFGGAAVKKIEKSETGNREFYAKWKADIELVNDCYEIHTADGLYKFADILNGTNGETANSGACGKLMEDIYVNGDVNTPLASMLNEDGTVKEGMDVKFWTPIGTEEHPFSGSFDGNGKKISGLYFNARENVVGLFGYVSGGTAKEPVTINGVGVEDSYIKGLHYVGGLLGKAYNRSTVSITNSYSIGSVTGSGDCVGGLLGYAESDSKVSITNSYSGGEVNGIDRVGGLLGYANEGSTVSITNGYNAGKVNGNADVGGLLGYAESDSKVSIMNSYNSGNVTGSGNAVGGLVGYAGGATITNSYNVGGVTGIEVVGGLVGFAGRDSKVSITNSYNVGSVTGSGDRVGGLLGNAFSATVSITNSYSTGSVTGSGDCVGGLLGYAYDGSTVGITSSVALEGSAGKLVGDGIVSTTSSGFASEDDFKNGTVAYALRNWCEKEDGSTTCKEGGLDGAAWGQDIGNDDYPTLSGSITVNGVEPVKYSIAYNLNGGSFSNYVLDFYLAGVGRESLPTPVYAGHTFLGWYSDEDFSGDVVTKIEKTESEAKTFFANWSKIYEIKVAVNDSKMGTVFGAGSYEYGAEITLVATAADGYKFSNWEDDAKAAATRKVTVSKAASYKANFEKIAASSSSKKASSSSSVKPGSSSSAKVAASSSSAKRNSSSSAKKDAIVASAKVPMFSVRVMGRNLQIAGAPVGEKIAILDMQGRVLSAGLASTGRVDAANFNVAMPRSGSYMVRIGNQVQRVNVK